MKKTSCKKKEYYYLYNNSTIGIKTKEALSFKVVWDEDELYFNVGQNIRLITGYSVGKKLTDLEVVTFKLQGIIKE